jgi:organic radical activating enzyme
MNETTFYISEIFQSIQGEGNFVGINSLFIRLQFCNLTCTWCDTRYTWNDKSGKYEEKSIEEIKNIIAKHSSYHIIFTGGEPLIHQLDDLIVPGKKFHVETNGTIIPTEPYEVKIGEKKLTRKAMKADSIKDFNFVVSPKLSNSRQKLNIESINYWSEQNNCIFKFIVQVKDDLNEVISFIEKFEINKKNVYIGLEGHSLQSQLQPLLVDEIIASGFNFSPRLHIMLWGNERGK